MLRTPPLILALALLAPTLQAQTLTSDITFTNNGSVRSVNAHNGTAFASLWDGAVQNAVDITVPSSPTLTATWSDTTLSDQWAEAVLHKGRLIHGHRHGDLSMWDLRGTSPAKLATADTIYHYDGLMVLDNGARQMLFAGEHPAAGRSGGLRIYGIAHDRFIPLGHSLSKHDRDGRFLVVTNDLFVYQIDGGAGSGSSNTLTLNLYDASTPHSPIFVQQFDGLGTTVGSYPGNTDLALSPDQQFLYVATGANGLKIVDISNRTSPVLVASLGTGFDVRELDMALGTHFLLVSLRDPFGTGDKIVAFDCHNPVAPRQITAPFGTPGFVINDIRVVRHPNQKPMLLVGGKNSAIQSVMEIWE